MDNPYKILGIEPNSSSKRIDKAYKRLTRKFDPSKSSDPNVMEQYLEITKAYEQLTGNSVQKKTPSPPKPLETPEPESDPDPDPEPVADDSTVINDFVYLDKTYGKIPCKIIPNELYTIQNDFDLRFYVHIIFDNQRLLPEVVPIDDIYPLEKFDKDLDRFEKIINIITDVPEISSKVFYDLTDFIYYVLLFLYCTEDQRKFIQSLSTNQLTEQPNKSKIIAPQIVRMTRRIFDKFDIPDVTYDIHNYRRLSDFYHISFPISLNVPNLEYNIYLIT